MIFKIDMMEKEICICMGDHVSGNKTWDGAPGIVLELQELKDVL